MRYYCEICHKRWETNDPISGPFAIPGYNTDIWYYLSDDGDCIKICPKCEKKIVRE